MGRLVARMAIAFAGALPLLLPGRAWAGAVVHTPASLEIREAATLSVVNDPPLQLLLSSGSDAMFTLTPGSPLQSGSADASLVVNRSGAWATASGEVLSVSLAGANEEQSGGAGDAPHIRYIIAQFN